MKIIFYQFAFFFQCFFVISLQKFIFDSFKFFTAFLLGRAFFGNSINFVINSFFYGFIQSFIFFVFGIISFRKSFDNFFSQSFLSFYLFFDSLVRKFYSFNHFFFTDLFHLPFNHCNRIFSTTHH